MNREIKFRAWDKKTKTMGWVVSYAGDMCTILWEGDRQECGIDTKNIEVMQYTGLKDKNSKEIYEGDIVYCFTKFTENETESNNCQVIWSDFHGGWMFEENKDSAFWRQSIDEVEVIGNIYENNKLI